VACLVALETAALKVAFIRPLTGAHVGLQSACLVAAEIAGLKVAFIRPLDARIGLHIACLDAAMIAASKSQNAAWPLCACVFESSDCLLGATLSQIKFESEFFFLAVEFL